jgi:hypothetical protein
MTTPPLILAPQSDQTDDAIAALVANVTNHETRIKALEAKPAGAPPPLTAPVITVTQTQQDALNIIVSGGFAILRGPTLDFVVQRA